MNFFEVLLMILCFISLILMIVGLFSPATSMWWHPNPLKRTRLYSFLIYFSITVAASMLAPNSGNVAVKSDVKTETADKALAKEDKVENVAVKIEEPQNWTYDTYEDEMTSAKSYSASTTSTNTAEFKFPYNGGSTFNLVLRKNNRSTDVYLNVSKGQFLGSYSSYLRVKFDDGQTANYSILDPDDGSTNVVFIENAHKFVEKLKKARKIKIEAQFYQEGRFVIYFNVAGLKWNK